jgi:hypothetical protein
MSLLKDGEAALTGAIGLAQGDASAIRFFPNSEPAFWRSFAAIAVVAPVDLAIATLQPRAADGEPHLLVELFTVCLLWGLFPLVMILVTRLVRLQARYPLFVIAYNWSSILIVAVLLPASILGAMSEEPGLFVSMVGLVSFGYAVWFSAFLARTVLATGWGNAIAIVVLDAALSLFVGIGVYRLAGLG